MLPARALHDPALALAPHDEQWVYQRLYDVYRGDAIRAADGADLIGTLATSVACLGDRPRDVIERALPGLQRRGLLVPVPVPPAAELGSADPPAPAAYTLKHAPHPRAKALHARPTHGAPVRSAVDEITVEGVVLPGGREANPHVVRAFRTKVSRHMTRHPNDPRRADSAMWATFVVDLWAEHQRTFVFRRATDAPAEAAVTSEATPPPPAAVTTPPGLFHDGFPSAVTGISEGVGGEKEIGSISLSSPGESGETTSQTPPARDPTPTLPVTSAVTPEDVTADVTDARPSTGLTPSFVWGTLRKYSGSHFGISGKAHRAKVYAIFVEEGVTRAEVEAMATLARRRELTGLKKSDRKAVSIQWALRNDAEFLHLWIDEARREVARQRELALNANDTLTGARSPAVPTTPKPRRPPAAQEPDTGPPGETREGPDPARAETKTPGPGALKSGITFKPSKVAL